MTEYMLTKFGIQTDGIDDYETFEDAVKTATDMSNGASWALGDLFNLSRERDDYEQAFDLTKKSLSTIQNYGTVARTFTQERRKFDLSFSHYREVCSLRDDNGNPLTEIQDNLLRQALNKQWTRDHIREKVKQAKGEVVKKKTVEAKVGLLDTTMMHDYGLDFGCMVKITYEVIEPVISKEDKAA